jgi:hypothetical protein
MRRSEIFDNFVKIALESDLISLDAPDKAKKQLEENPRADSLSTKDIQKLYKTKPNTPKDMEYKHNIIEDAHPSPAIISPAYDKINGLVENINERQNIMINIVNKTPDGHLTQHRYAEQNFILSLVKIANYLDNNDKDELRVLADTCLEQIQSKKKVKTAALPALLLPIAVAVAGVLSGIWLQQHSDLSAGNFEQTLSNLKKEIEDITKESTWKTLGLEPEYKESLIADLNHFLYSVNLLSSAYNKAESVISRIHTPKDAKELIQMSKQSNLVQAIKSAKDQLIAQYKNILPAINQLESNFKSNSFKRLQIKDKGWVSSLADKLHLKNTVIADDFEDVIRALNPFKQSVEEMIQLLNESENFQEKARKSLEEVQSGASKFESTSPASPEVSLESEDDLRELEKAFQI